MIQSGKIEALQLYGLLFFTSAKRKSRRRRVKLAQASIELVLGFVVIALLFGAVARMFVWFGNSLIQRQTAFEQTRAINGSAEVQPGDIQDIGYIPQAMNFLED